LFNSYKGGCYFFEVKRSNKIETVQYFKNAFLYLGFQGQIKNHMKLSDLGKSLDPAVQTLHFFSKTFFTSTSKLLSGFLCPEVTCCS
jgi:hypothetical protein